MKDSSPSKPKAPKSEVGTPSKEMTRKQYILVIGSITDGYEFVGPFDSSEALSAFAKQNNINDCEWAQLRSPVGSTRFDYLESGLQ